MTQPPPLPADYARLIASDRVSERTRIALLARAQPDDPAYQPHAMPPACFATLRALTDRILPQTGAVIDIAQRLDALLAVGLGDGWRFADLPADRDAYETGLAALDAWARAAHGKAFASLEIGLQDAMLSDMAAGRAPAGGGRMSPAHLARWFEDVRADATRLYVAHPSTLARIRYAGFAYGGDSKCLPGFHALKPGEHEAWEPGA